MPSIFSRFKSRDGTSRLKSKKGSNFDLSEKSAPKPRWEDAYTRKTVEPEEIQELIRRCTEELKARALDHPFLLLPFRPTSDPSAVRTFIRHFFDPGMNFRGETLSQELRMTPPMVIAGVAKWCWSRLAGGIVGWDAYELFKVGEQDSNMARDSFKTFIPLSVDNGARSCIIFDFFDLLAAIAAHGKMNGLGGRKLSRMAAWWAFEQRDTGNGFEGGYKTWLSAADATCHLFFAYLRSLAPQSNRSTISMLPMSLQKLLQETEYPPQRPSLMQTTTQKVIMIVDTVSPTPFSLLRRASHFQYRDEDRALQEFSEYEDPVQALTEECRRVLKAISSANQSQVSSSKHSTSLRDASWSRFEDIGFGGVLDEEDEDDDGSAAARKPQGLRTTPASGMGLGRPTTPSWADFLSSGFVDDNPNAPSNLLLPPDKILPPIETTVRQRSSQSHKPRLETERHLEPGELASINKLDLDDCFWWVWMTSLAPEETPERKATFGRCAVIETVIRSGRWLVIEEMVAGAAPEPAEGAYVAEKKSFFSWTRRNKIGRRKSTGKQALDKNQKPLNQSHPGLSKASIGPDQHAKIQAAAAQLQARQLQEKQARAQKAQLRQQELRRGRSDADLMQEKTNSVFTLQPVIMNEASPAMKWANKYDKEAIREAYLANSNAGRGLGTTTMQTNGTNGHAVNGHREARDVPPEVPSKEPSFSEPSPLPQTSPFSPMSMSSRIDEEPEPKLSEKAIEAPLDPHPAERAEASRSAAPVQEKEPSSLEMMRGQMASPDLSPESKKLGQQKKLQKDNKVPNTGGFRKLFGRKNRSSKLPENAAADLNGMLAQKKAADSLAVKEPFSRSMQSTPTPSQEPEYEDRTPLAHTPGDRTPTAIHPEISYDPSVDESLSRVDTADANEARHEFSRFDQGPLDAPAFIPEDSDTEDAVPPPIARHAATGDEDDAVPPPIARHAHRDVEKAISPVTEHSIEEEPQSAGKPAPPMQDRWAQIRKNAAERAAHRQGDDQPPPNRGGQSKTTDGDDDTSGEETIESRVARIKARVAELTGNMENMSGPGAPRR